MAEINLKVDGTLPDGKIVIIQGEFIEIDCPNRLTYTWSTDQNKTNSEKVTVKFNQQGDETEIVIIHEKILEKASKLQHEKGWIGCLYKL